MASAARRRVRAEMQLKGNKAVGGPGSPGGEGADAAESVIAAESAPCKVLVGEGACWVTDAVVAAGASAKLVRPSEGATKTDAKAVSGAGKNDPWSERRRWWRRQTYKRRISQKEQRGRQSSYVARARKICENRENPNRRKGAHPKWRPRGVERIGCDAHRPG